MLFKIQHQTFTLNPQTHLLRYTRIAMGKNTAMDVVTGESSGTSGQLLLLYPLLFGGYLRVCICALLFIVPSFLFLCR
jgi:hypothetical protein